MEQVDTYHVCIDGVSYDVLVAYQVTQPREHALGPIIEPSAQAPWVTAQRIAHLPPR